MDQWRPTASDAARRARANLLARLREYFARAQVLEVETPILSAAGTTDPNIDSARVSCGAVSGYLHTSPEFAMKRLLADGCGDCYQIARVFRAGELGAWHNPEFTMLEWYRVGYSLDQIIDDTLAVLHTAFEKEWPVQHWSFRDACLGFGNFDPFDPEVEQIQYALTTAGQALPIGLDASQADAWIDCAFSVLVAPRFASDEITVVSGYPPSQASLAKIASGPDGYRALRAEVYVGELELGNGFEELTHAGEQRARFEREREQRLAVQQHAPPLDQNLIDAIQTGLPACSGMALGLDRVLMSALGLDRIDGVLNFPWGRA